MCHFDYIVGWIQWRCKSLISEVEENWFYVISTIPTYINVLALSLDWRHNGRDSVSNHQPHDCLFNRLFRRRWKKTSKLRVTGLCTGKWPVTRKMFPFDDVIMCRNCQALSLMLTLEWLITCIVLCILRSFYGTVLGVNCHLNYV